jgi:hypothetical protein
VPDRPVATVERRPAVPIVRALGITSAVLLLLGSAFQLAWVLAGAPGGSGNLLHGFAHTFYADDELGVWAWFNALLFSLLAVAFLLRSLVHRASGLPSVPLIVLGVAALYFSADETAALHEKLRVGARALNLRTGTYDWLVLGVPVALVAAVVLFLIARRLDRVLRRRLVVAAVVYVLGAAALEYVGGVIAKAPGLGATTPLYILEVTIEEGLEAAGILVAMWAVLADLVVLPGQRGIEVALEAVRSRTGVREAAPQRS